MRLRPPAIWLAAPAAALVALAVGIARAQSPAALSPGVRDVALDAEGRLGGFVGDAEGRPLARAKIVAWTPGQNAIVVTAGHDGRFRLPPLAGGIYRFTSSSAGEVYRVWPREAAPPGAATTVRLTSGPTVVRGQTPNHFFQSNMFLIPAAAVGPVAIPIAIGSAQRDLPPGS